MKLIFFLGKGGVGKSTLSILNALAVSQQDRSVALISLDRAHNLFDILRAESSELPSLLKVIEADLDRFVRQYLQETEAQLRRNYSYLTAINLEEHFKILRLAPGMEEYGLLLAFKHFYEKFKEFDYLIFDMPPTALALKFFGLPSVSLLWLKQLIKLRDEILKKKEIISGVKFGKKEIETDKVKNNLLEQQKRYRNLLELFRNESSCHINVVSNPDSVSLAESKRIYEFLSDLEIPVHQLFINKSSDKHGDRMLPPFFMKKNIFFSPKSRFPLIGISNLQKYLKVNKRLIDSLDK